MTRARSRLLACALAGALVVAPGCVVGSPLAAFSGEPYGMTIDDWRALQGRNGPIWADAPIFAAIDLPFAAVLDTGLLPISLMIWGLKSLGGGGDDHDHGDGGHDHGEDGHTHGHGDDPDHTHGAGKDPGHRH